MVLAGVGGRTIAELADNLTYAEYLSWVKYRNKYGNLNPNIQLARMTSFMANFRARESAFDWNDLLFYGISKPDTEPTIDNIFAALMNSYQANTGDK